MEESTFIEWIFPLFLIVLLVGTVAFYICSDMITERKGRKIGVVFEKQSMDDCREAASMLVDYIHHVLDNDERQHKECKEAGCDGSIVLRDSCDIGRLVNLVHKAGGRLVVRRVAYKDIECARNTVLEVKKQLSELDIARAKRIERKYKR